MNRNDIFVIYGTTLSAMTAELLEKADLKEQILEKADALGIKPSGMKIGLKPNLVGAIPAEQGATTHVEIVRALVLYLQAEGFQNLLILEGSWVGDRTERAFKSLGYEALSREYKVPLLDTKKDHFIKKSYEEIEMEISKAALSLDFLINLPVLKGHCQTKMTGALKNLKGIISDNEKRHFHSLGLHKPIAYLNKLICADFVLVDGICGDLDFEEGGNPVAMNRILCGLDSVLIDSYIADTMGYAPDDIGYLTIADKIGVGSKHLEQANILELNQDTTKTKPSSSRRVRKLAEYVAERDACSACYANLIQALARLEDTGKLHGMEKPSFAIGQGFREKKSCTGTGAGISSENSFYQKSCIGAGNCTRSFSRYVPGCPVRAADILSFLSDL